MKLSDIAHKLSCRLEGTDCDIAGVIGIEEAQPGHLTFITNPKYAADAKTTKASAIIVDEKFPALNIPTLRSKNPYLAFARAIKLFYQVPQYAPGIHATAVISRSAKLGKDAHIGAYAVIGDDVTIGDNAIILPHVVIYQGCRIGNNFFAHAHAVVREYCTLGNDVVLQNGVIIGADGFGFAKDDHGRWEKITQSGPVILADDIEVQANSCVDRASVGETRVGSNTKIDNLVQVGHGCSIGERTMLCAQVGLAGSTVIKNNVILAGQAGVAGHCTINDNVVITAQSGTHGDIAAGAMMSGSPAIESRQWARAIAAFNKLPELMKTIRSLENRLSSIEQHK